MSAKPRPTLRCAVYTRVSTEYGLEQDFNSLDAQREASEAYINSQIHEGWKLISTKYDDAGFSGGTTNRPALQRLLQDIGNGLIDVVVVYKVDRLTRSLADFAKLVDIFEANNVSFVSVTQAFNTTSSMGRLTLNVLLSFAQFEREVSGERIRDKVAASKRKGMRMGGPIPLGYDVRDKKLVPNQKEAAHIKIIFEQYLELGCISKLVADLRRRRIFSKRTVKPGGKPRGGIPFTRGPLANLLQNRVYVGEVVHKDKHYPGEHKAILDRKLFDAVQSALASRAKSRGAARLKHEPLLIGKIFDERGTRFSPSATTKGSLRYRYYVAAADLSDKPRSPCSRIPAPEIETVVLAAIKKQVGQTALSDEQLVSKALEKVIVKASRIDIHFVKAAEGVSKSLISVPWKKTPSKMPREILIPSSNPGRTVRPIRAETRARLLDGIVKARVWLNELVSGAVTDTRQIAIREKCSDRSVRMTLSLAFLSPKIVQAAIAGALPDGFGITQLMSLPPDWAAQARQIALGVGKSRFGNN